MNTAITPPRVGAPIHVGALMRLVLSRYGIDPEEIDAQECEADGEAAESRAVGTPAAVAAGVSACAGGYQGRLF